MAYIGPVDLTQVKNLNEAIPDGIYSAFIKETDVKATKNGEGKYIYLGIEVTEGEYSGKIVEDRLNFDNPNSKAQNIGQLALKRLCEALGVNLQQDTCELEGKPFKVKIVLKPAEKYTDKNGIEKMGYPQNEVKGYYPYNYSEGQASVPPVVTTPVATQDAGPFKVRQ